MNLATAFAALALVACSSPVEPITAEPPSAPVADAGPKPTGDAAQPGSNTSSETCDKSFTTSVNQVVWYAERAYPGKSVADLARVVAVIAISPNTGAPYGYTSMPTLVYLRDGSAAAFCGQGQTVTFVGP